MTVVQGQPHFRAQPARERSERASVGAGARKEKSSETLVYKGILYYPTLKSRCGITVPHLFRAKTV